MAHSMHFFCIAEARIIRTVMKQTKAPGLTSAQKVQPYARVGPATRPWVATAGAKLQPVEAKRMQHAADACCSRRQFAIAAAAAFPWLLQLQTASAGESQKIDPQLLKAFQEALAARSYKLVAAQEQEAAWTKAINISPSNAAAWSNRGTAHLQNGHWHAAYEDLVTALQLEQQQTGAPSAILLNNLGNAEGALGRWKDAMQHYQQAADDAEIGSIALANYSLAAFEMVQDDLAIRAARMLLRRDPEFLDMRCALTAFLWASGKRADAEDSWERLQQDADGLGAALYSRATAVERVRHRWPPRATAALTAFLRLSDNGQAEGYDLQMHEYRFAA